MNARIHLTLQSARHLLRPHQRNVILFSPFFLLSIFSLLYRDICTVSTPRSGESPPKRVENITLNMALFIRRPRYWTRPTCQVIPFYLTVKEGSKKKEKNGREKAETMETRMSSNTTEVKKVTNKKKRSILLFFYSLVDVELRREEPQVQGKWMWRERIEKRGISWHRSKVFPMLSRSCARSTANPFFLSLIRLPSR